MSLESFATWKFCHMNILPGEIFYNINSIVGYDSCVIVEGEMDVLAMHEAGIKNVISVPNGATLNSNNLEYLDNCID